MILTSINIRMKINLEEIKNKIYLYSYNEYVITGRIAKQKMSSGKEKILFEIIPLKIYRTLLDNKAPINGTYSKWVLFKQLMPIDDLNPKEDTNNGSQPPSDS